LPIFVEKIAQGGCAGAHLRLLVDVERFGEGRSDVSDEDAQGFEILRSYQRDCRSEMSHNTIQHLQPLSEQSVFRLCTIFAPYQTYFRCAFIAFIKECSQNFLQILLFRAILR